MNIRIPNPCHEDWSQMQPEEQGRYCGVCSKTVMDFTDWEPDAIMAWLRERQGQKVCGRFTAAQVNGGEEPAEVNWPRQIALSALSWCKKVAAVIVVVFSVMASSCNDKTPETGKKPEPARKVSDTDLTGVVLTPLTEVKDSGVQDPIPPTTFVCPPFAPPVVTMGTPAVVVPDPPEPMIVGELAVPDTMVPLLPPPPPPVEIDSAITGQLVMPTGVKQHSDSLPVNGLKRIP